MNDILKNSMNDIASFNNLPFCVIFYMTIYYILMCAASSSMAKLFFWRTDERIALSLTNWNKILSIPYLLFCLDSNLDGVYLPFLLQDKLFSIQLNKCGLGVL